jgi:CO/xanthine dehydrogenase Mo-binding subunit
MGVGYAMYEDIMFKGGNVLNPNLLNYKVPTVFEMPEVEAILVECHHKEGPYGAKGPGECTNVATPPAIANAIYDAVGIRIKDLPITPDKVLEALKLKAAQENV